MKLTPQERGSCQEVRLAVVMYGGVSLAIYMNGVAQEILRLVRGTAVVPDPNPWNRMPLLAEPEGTEKVYRQLGQILHHDHASALGPYDPSAPIYSNFVVDVLSGTSAGGINAVFLAKALATDGSLDSLRDLWMNEGDIALLVNDRGSTKNAPTLMEQSPPKSLLNGRRMYLRLREAFDEMDPPGGPPKPPSPYVNQLDLFVTATDLHGSALPIRLADGIVWERRYRNVFHFRYEWDSALDRKQDRPRNDFDAGDGNEIRNGHLAFASRATSAFPFAFEPMTLDQADESTSEEWEAFFKDQLESTAAEGLDARAAKDLAFGDGGYLDNKPFSYAIDSLSTRVDEGTIPIDRKLLFVEPAPTQPEDDPLPSKPPDALQNVGLALLTLPRYETVHEDLQRLLDRNKLARWVNEILEGTDTDVYYGHDYGEIPDREGFAEKDLAEMVVQKGVAYGPYHRLKIYILTDEIAGALTAVGGFRRDSEEFETIRAIVLAWRRDHYVENRVGALPDRTQNSLLVDFDLSFRIRRLRYVRRKADALLRLDDKSWSTLWSAGISWKPEGSAQQGVFSDKILDLKRETRVALRELLETKQLLKAKGEANPLYEVVRTAGIGIDTLKRIFRAETDLERREKVSEVFSQKRAEIERVMGRLREVIGTAADTASRISEESLEVPGLDASDGNETMEPDRAARLCLWYYYQRYEDYDLGLLPILHVSGLGEERDGVEILRISPRDASSMIDEKTDPRRKLAGTALFNFGAFLDRGWRRNDFLWGRLDAAERLISSVLPGDANREARKALVVEAHSHIIREEISGEDQAEVCRMLVQAVLTAKSAASNEVFLRELIGASPDGVTHPALEAVLELSLEDDTLLDFFRNQYEVDRHLDRAATLAVVSRATRVIGKMFEDLSDSRSAGSVRTRWLSRLAQVFWGLVEVAVPGSFANLVLQHLVKVLYAFEVTVVVLAAILQSSVVLRFGLLSLGLTFGLHILTLVVEDFMRRKARLAWWILVVFVATVFLFAIYGGMALFAPQDLPPKAEWYRWLFLFMPVGVIATMMLVRGFLRAYRDRRRLAGSKRRDPDHR